MKKPVCVILCALCTASSAAEEIVTVDGRTYEGATITRTEPDGIVIMHAAGVAKIPFTELSEELRARFRYNPAAAQKHASATAEQQRLLGEERARVEAKINARRAVEQAAADREGKAVRDRRALRSFTMEARETGTTATGYNTWETRYGSYDRQQQQGKRVIVSVHDVSGNTARVTVRLYLVGIARAKNEHMVATVETRELTVRGGQEASVNITTAELQSRVLNLAALGVVAHAGLEMEGWIAEATIDGVRIGLKGSNEMMTMQAETLLAHWNARLKRADAD